MSGYPSSSTTSEDDDESTSSSEHPLNEGPLNEELLNQELLNQDLLNQELLNQDLLNQELQDPDKEWEVEYIEDTVLKDAKRYYLIKYRDYSPSEWHDETAVGNSELLVGAFWRSLNRPGTKRDDWIAEQIKALEEEPEIDEEEEEPDQEPEASTSKVPAGLIIKEIPIKKRKKKKKKKPKENQEEQINSDFANSSSSSSGVSTYSIESSENSYQDSEVVDFISSFVPKNLETKNLVECSRQEKKQLKIREHRFKEANQEIIEKSNDHNYEECLRDLRIYLVKDQLENDQQVENSNNVQIDRIDNNQRKDKGKGEGKGKVKANGNGNENGRKRKRNKRKGTENGNPKGTEKGKERAREEEEIDSNQKMNENRIVVVEEEEEEEEEESEDALEVTNKRLKKMTIPVTNSLKKLLRIPNRN